jgi:hypothetical protein
MVLASVSFEIIKVGNVYVEHKIPQIIHLDWLIVWWRQ